MIATEFRLTGDLGAPGFADWVCHRARLLDLRGWVAADGPTAMRIVVIGPKPLVDAMEMACSLGPVDVLVEDVATAQFEMEDPPGGFLQRFA